MQQGYSRIGMSRVKQRTLVIVSVVVLLAMILSFTLAWFAQLLVSRDNAILSGAGTSSVELWGQSALGGRFGGDFLDIASADFEKTTQVGDPDGGLVGITQSYLEPETDSSTLNPSRFIPQNYLYKIVGESTDQNPSGLVYKDGNTSGGEYNRLLNDTGLLPKNRIKRRVIVYNSPDAPQNVSYNVTFPFQLTQKVDEFGQPVLIDGAPVFETVADSALAEAIRVDVAKLSPQPGVTGVNAEEAIGLTSTVGASLKAVSDVSGIDVVQLHSKSLTGTLRPGEFDVYEFSFTFLDSASNFYETLLPDSEDMALSLDIQVTAKAGTETHYISTEAELYQLLYPGTQNPAALKDGDTIEIAAGAELKIDNFITDKMFNLVMNTGSKLTVTDNFRVVIPKDKNGQDKFGTIDILYGMSLADISTQPLQFGQNCRLVINAPKVALRWNNQIAQDSTPFIRQPDNSDSSTELNVRTFNGVEALHKGVSTDLSVSMDGFDSIEPAPAFQGSGTADDPYQIGSAASYKKLMNDVNTGIDYAGIYFIQSADLDFSSVSSVLPIGGSSSAWDAAQTNAFAGTYNGNGHIVQNLEIQSTESNIGLFGIITNGALIENVSRIGGSTTGSEGVGGIAGAIYGDGTIRNCYNDSEVYATTITASGIVAYTYHSGVHRIENCYNLGTVTANNSNAAGIVSGFASDEDSHGYIIGCFNAGKLEVINPLDHFNMGGIVAYSFLGTNRISNCYNIGQMVLHKDSSYVGVIASGMNSTTTFHNNYYLDKSAPAGYSGFGAMRPSGDRLPDLETTAWPLTHGQMVGTEPITGTEAINGKTFVELLNTGLDSTLAFRAAPAGSDYRFPWTPLQEDLDYTVQVGMYITPDAADGSLKYTSLAPVQPDGAGTEEDPYLIDTPNHWRWLESETNASKGRHFAGTYFKLLCNFDYVDVVDTKPVGHLADKSIGYDFNGILDGNCHIIKNFSYSETEDQNWNNCIGIVGLLSDGGVVRNLGKVGGEINCGHNAGGIVGLMLGNTLVENCFNTGKVTAKSLIAGGIVANSHDVLTPREIRNCYNTGAVHGGGRQAGGIIGLWAGNNFKITSCYNTGSVTGGGRWTTGALVGPCNPVDEEAPHEMLLENSYALKGTGDGIYGIDPEAASSISISLVNSSMVTDAELSGDEMIAKLNAGDNEEQAAFVRSNYPGAPYPRLWWETKQTYMLAKTGDTVYVAAELQDAGIPDGDFTKYSTNGHNWSGGGYSE